MSMFLMIHFGSDLQALETSQHPIKIENFQQLYENPDIKIMVVEKGNVKSLMKTRHNQLSERLVDIKHEELFSKKIIIKVIKENKVFIDSYDTIARIIRHYNEYSLIQSHDHCDTNFVGYPLRKNLNTRVKYQFSTM